MNTPAENDLLSSLQIEWNHLLDESVRRIQHCMSQLSHEQVWWRPSDEQNSIGSLLRHLAGNLNQWVVVGVRQLPDSRDREAEFHSPARESPEQLLAMLCQVVDSAKSVLETLQPDDLIQPRQIQSFNVSVLGAIMHSVPHFVGHSHQIGQLTRIQLGNDYVFQWDPDGPRYGVPL